MVVGLEGHNVALGACIDLKRDVLGVDSDYSVPVFAIFSSDGSNDQFIVTGIFVVKLLHFGTCLLSS